VRSAAVLVALAAIVVPGVGRGGAARPQATLVELAPGVRAPAALRAAGTRISAQPAIWLLRGARAPRLVPALERAGLVRDVEPDRLVAPLDASESAAGTAVRAGWWLAGLDAAGLQPPGPGKPVTVVDTGLDLTHPEFAGRPNTVALNRQRITSADDFHGTAVSSLVGAQGKRMLGIYPQARLYEWDAASEGGLSLSGIIAGIRAATRIGPGVINLSFGSEADVPMLEDVIMAAFRRGSLVVAATGDSRGIDFSPYPGSYPHVLTVAATDRNGRVSIFSTPSSSIDVAAPGTQIEVAVPRLRDPSGYVVSSGTSYSAALVSGAVAWIWTRRPSLDNTQLIELVRQTARRARGAGFSNDVGYGILDVRRALTAPAPPRDPLEPNDDVSLALDEPVVASGTHRHATIAARVDQNKDPHDVYRVLLPPNARLRASTHPTSGDVAVRLWGPRTQTVAERGPGTRRDLLAACTTGRCVDLATVNRSGRAEVVYVDVAPGVARTADYTLALTVRG